MEPNCPARSKEGKGIAAVNPQAETGFGHLNLRDLELSLLNLRDLDLLPNCQTGPQTALRHGC